MFCVVAAERTWPFSRIARTTAERTGIFIATRTRFWRWRTGLFRPAHLQWTLQVHGKILQIFSPRDLIADVAFRPAGPSIIDDRDIGLGVQHEVQISVSLQRRGRCARGQHDPGTDHSCGRSVSGSQTDAMPSSALALAWESA